MSFYHMDRFQNNLLFLLFLVCIISPIPFAYGVSLKVDHYNGTFNHSKVQILAVNDSLVTHFTINPIMNITGVNVSAIVPSNSLIIENQSSYYLDTVYSNNTYSFLFKFNNINLERGAIRIKIIGYYEGTLIENSYSFNIWNGITGKSHVSKISGQDEKVLMEKTFKQSPSGLCDIIGRFMYVDEDGIHQPARLVYIELWDDDNFSDADYLSNNYTDADGYYVFKDIPNIDPEEGTLDPFIWVCSDNIFSEARDEYDNNYWVYSPTEWNIGDGVTDFGQQYFVSYNEAFQAIDATLDVVIWLYNETGHVGEKIPIYWPLGDWPASWGTGIELPEKYIFDWGRDTVFHEYGHCIAFEIYGNRWPPGDGGSHYIWSEDNQGDAICEGWAEFVQCAVVNDPTIISGTFNGHGGNLENNDWFNCEDSGDMDGSYVEGSVASILWDIYDPINDDPLYGGLDEIWDIFYSYNPDSIHEFWSAWFSAGYNDRNSLNWIFWEYGIDKNEVPTTQIMYPNVSKWFSGNVNITASSDDIDGDCTAVSIGYNLYSNNVSDLNWILIGNYSIISNNWYYEWNSTPITSDLLYFRARTFDGYEWGEWSINEYYIGIDNSIPNQISLNTSHLEGIWYSHNSPEFMWSIPEDNGSGIHFFEGIMDEGAVSNYTLPCHPTVSDGIHSFKIRAVDYAGNVGLWSNTVHYQIDTTCPVGSILVNSGDKFTFNRNVTLSLYAEDGGLSGVNDVCFSSNQVNWTEWFTYNTTFEAILPEDYSTQKVYVKFRDNVDLESEIYSDSIVLVDESCIGSNMPREYASNVNIKYYMDSPMNYTNLNTTLLLYCNEKLKLYETQILNVSQGQNVISFSWDSLANLGVTNYDGGNISARIILSHDMVEISDNIFSTCLERCNRATLIKRVADAIAEWPVADSERKEVIMSKIISRIVSLWPVVD